MKLNIEEQNFVYRWSKNYPEAIKSARKYHEEANAEYNPKTSIAEMTEEIESHMYHYASYKYWYGIMFGMIQGMSFKVNIQIYGACLRALKHLEEEAYGYEKEII